MSNPFQTLIASAKPSTPAVAPKAAPPLATPLASALPIAQTLFDKAVKTDDSKQLAGMLLQLKDGKAEEVLKLLGKITKHVNDDLIKKQSETAKAMKGSSTAICSVPNISCLSPRGRCNIAWFEDSVEVAKPNGKETHLLSTCKIRELISLPNPHKKGERFFVLFTSEIQKQTPTASKTLHNFSLVVNAGKEKLNLSLVPGTRADLPSKLNGSCVEVMTQLLPAVISKQLVCEDKVVFNSTTGKPYLKCYHKTSDGMLYPLANGLLFVKPFLFVSREDITAISAAKVGTGRTFNVNITLDDSSEIEFSMLEYEELGVMKAYMAWIQKKAEAEVKQEAKEQKDGITSGGYVDEEDTEGEDDEEDNSDDDEDFDDDEAEDSEGSCSEEALSDDCDGYDGEGPSTRGSVQNKGEEVEADEEQDGEVDSECNKQAENCDSSGLSSDDEDMPPTKRKKTT